MLAINYDLLSVWSTVMSHRKIPVWTSGIAGAFLLMWAENCFVPLVRSIGVETPIADVVEVTRRPKTFWVWTFIPCQAYPVQ